MGVFRGLDTAEVARRVGASVRQLGHWDRLGIVSPSIAPARGSGTRRMYAEDDLAYVLMVKAARQLGGTLELAYAIVSAVRFAHRDLGSFSGLRLVAGPESVRFCGVEMSEYRACLDSTAASMVLNLETIAIEARRMAKHPSRPSVEVLELEGAVIQVIVVPEAESFAASAKKFPGLKAAGRSVSAAIEALRRAIESEPAIEEAKVEARSTPATKSGASAWGGEW